MATKANTAEDRQEYYDVTLPRVKGEDAVYVSVNGERIMVQRGKRVTLPRRFALALANSMAQEDVAEAFIRNNAM